MEQVAEKLGIKVAEAKKIQNFVFEVSPLENLDTTNDDDGRGIPEGVQPREIDEAILVMERDQELDELMNQLTERERNILRYRYGLEDFKAHTLEETGRRFGLTRERIRQIENDAMKNLRRYVEEHADQFER